MPYNPETYRLYRATERGKEIIYRAVNKYNEKNKEKQYIWRKVQRAIETGTIVKPTDCSECGKTARLDAHHEDYSKPLGVIWLCRQCHIYKRNKP